MRLPVFNAKGERTQEILEIDEQIFGSRVRDVLLKEVILMYEARKRVGTHSTKTRSDCAGSGKKLWRQKGTGRARVGRARAPHWRGGGTVFGPHPRDYSYSVPKKARKLACDSAWLAKLQDKEILVFDDLGITEAKTSKVYQMLKTVGIENQRVAFAVHESNDALWKSIRNLPKVSMDTITRFNAYTLVSNDKIIVTKQALENLISSRGEGVKVLKREEVYGK